jgi:hypothetical protein
MRTDDRLAEVRKLRQQGLAPKQIAKALGIGSAEATRLVRAVAATRETAEPALIGCWISPTWSTGLIVEGHPDWPRDEDPTSGFGGLAQVLVARRHRYDKVSVCGYLTDVYCLGVKNVYGPDIMDELELRTFLPLYYRSHGTPLEAPIELAQEVVFGSIEYARGLGFEPHQDFDGAKSHLGTWTAQGGITFGKEGRPFYVNGPYDNPRTDLRTLERSVGSGNFDVMIGGQL